MLTALLLSALAAEPIIVADVAPPAGAVPGDTDSTIRSLRLRLLVALTAADYIPIERDAARAAVGDALATCADRPGCPADLFPLLPARLALVVRLGGNAAGEHTAEITLYEREDPAPVVSFSVLADTSDFEARTLDSLREITALLGPVPEPMLARAVALVTDAQSTHSAPGAHSATAAPERTNVGTAAPTRSAGVVAPPTSGPTPAEATPAPPPAVRRDPVPPPAPAAPAPLPRYTAGVRSFMTRSKLTADTWMAVNTPHAGRLIFELRGGVGLGDVDRHLDVSAAVAADQTVTTNWQLSPQTGTSGQVMMFIGYAPNAWFDLTLGFGMHIGKATWNVDWVLPDGTPGSGEGSSVLMQPTVSPRGRVYLVPIGPVKPYATVGGDFRFYFQPSVSLKGVPDLELPVGGNLPGVLVGGGISFDAAPTIGILIEGTWTRHFGADSGVTQSVPVVGAPETPALGAPAAFRNETVGVVAGLQVRL